MERSAHGVELGVQHISAWPNMHCKGVSFLTAHNLTMHGTLVSTQSTVKTVIAVDV